MSTPTRRRSLRTRLLAIVTGATDRLVAAWRILTRAQKTLLAVLARIRPGRGATARIRTATNAFQQQIGEFDRAVTAFTERWASQDLPIAYREGALSILDHLHRPHRTWSWTRRHQETVTGLTAQYYADLMGRLREAVRRARAFLRDAELATRARITQFTVPQFDQQQLQQDHPLDTVIYANDSRHPVEAWARAALSWQTITAANTAAARTALDDLGIEWLEVSDGPGCGWRDHQDPDVANGTLRTVQDALEHPAAHPNCVRQFLPRPAIITGPSFAPGGPF